MARRFTFNDLVQLPKLDAASAVTLVHRLMTLSAKHKRLPEGIQAARKRLAAAQRTVEAGLSERLAVPVGDARRARRADQAEDLAFSALFDFLTAWSKLPAEVQGQGLAEELLGKLFPDGLKFTQLTYHQQWAEANARLQRIATEGLLPRFKQLSGEPFVTNLQKAHKEYGEALGVTTPRETAAPVTAPVREPLQQLLSTLRQYVLQIVASVDEDTPASVTLAEELLAPLTEWQSRPGLRPGAPEEPAPAPAPPAP